MRTPDDSLSLEFLFPVSLLSLLLFVIRVPILLFLSRSRVCVLSSPTPRLSMLCVHRSTRSLAIPLSLCRALLYCALHQSRFRSPRLCESRKKPGRAQRQSEATRVDGRRESEVVHSTRDTKEEKREETQDFSSYVHTRRDKFGGRSGMTLPRGREMMIFVWKFRTVTSRRDREASAAFAKRKKKKSVS